VRESFTCTSKVTQGPEFLAPWERSGVSQPVVYDLYCGLGGWSEGFLAEGYRCIGFDIEAHDYGTGGYPGELIIRDVLTIHGSELKDAAVIVASPPCQEPSYRAMPWSRAKALNAAGPPHKFLELFNACFRIQREASEAAGRHIPLIVENVRGAQDWVGPARWKYGSFYLWGDVPALMPPATRVADHIKTVGHVNKRDGYSHTRHLTSQRESDAVKVGGIDFNKRGVGFNTTAAQRYRDGIKNGNDWFGSGVPGSLSRIFCKRLLRSTPSGSFARCAASTPLSAALRIDSSLLSES